MGGLDSVWAAVLPAADRPHPCAFSFTRRGTSLRTNLTVCFFLDKTLAWYKCKCLRHTDLYVSPAAAPTGPAASHQTLWDRALSARRHGAGGLHLFPTEVFWNCETSSWLTACLFYCPSSAWVEEDSPGQNGSSTKSWLCSACGQLHSQVSGETQHGYLPHQIFCNRGKSCISSWGQKNPQSQDWMFDLSKLPFCWLCW